MTATVRGRVTNETRITSLYIALAATVAAAGFAGGTFSHAHSFTRTVRVGTRLSAVSAARLAAAWGTPDQQVSGSQVNPNLAGTTCDIWQSKRAVLCYQP